MSRQVLSLSSVGKTYKTHDSIEVLSDINISIDKGEFVCLIGPNGCGKSSLLKIIAGIFEPSTGSIKTAGTAYLPQQPSLLPWRTLNDNLLLPNDIKNRPKGKARSRAQRLLKDFKLSEFADYYPDALSGGMQQKAALLRTVLSEPELMLLDEPFSALDAITRSQMQAWLLDLWQRTKPAVICVTHDVREAIFLADTIYVMSGRPGTLKRKITVDIKRPRRLQHMHSAAAKELENELNRLLAVKL